MTEEVTGNVRSNPMRKKKRTARVGAALVVNKDKP
jgi:hypothetical protein